MTNAKAEAALRDVSSAFKNSSLKVPLQAAQLLGGIGLVDEQEDLEEAMRTDVANAAAIADGAAGDAVKYLYAVKSMQRRWDIYVALFKRAEEQPSLEMAKEFAAFMYKFRQRASAHGRAGLGDSRARRAGSGGQRRQRAARSGGT